MVSRRDDVFVMIANDNLINLTIQFNIIVFNELFFFFFFFFLDKHLQNVHLSLLKDRVKGIGCISNNFTISVVSNPSNFCPLISDSKSPSVGAEAINALKFNSILINNHRIFNFRHHGIIIIFILLFLTHDSRIQHELHLHFIILPFIIAAC